MSKRPEPPIRAISILVGIMIGCVLAYAFQVNIPTLFHETYVWASLVIFVTTPVLAGFVTGLIHPELALKNGMYVGFFSGIFNSIIAAIKFVYATEVMPSEIYAFSMFIIVSVFLWMILAATAAILAQKFYE